ncbi:MAG: S4 domain-containing protein [Actinomyces sp.]|uniref:RNA-binding S4 domain-containing protein n=1 Tax=Actinomyces sp. TaxID=29317 RepID=UPI0026DB796B|nr:S4 domain-containing protein [Actinomyces sp.]MDO4243333.1 S4 domain-containing protein [Actinomyces sp.]
MTRRRARSQPATEHTEAGPVSARVDVWLWSVRQVGSRSAATAACRAGHVRVNGETAKAAQQVSVGDEIRYRVRGFDRRLVVRRVLVKRVGAPVARTAYEDVSEPLPSALDAPAPILRARGSGRPTKKERRQLDALRGIGGAAVEDIEALLDSPPGPGAS